MKTLHSSLAAALVALALAAPAPAPAQDAPAPAPAPAAKKKERKATGTLSEGMYRQLERVHDLIGKNKNAEALEKASALVERASGPYEKAVVHQTMGFIHAAQNNYKAALRSFEEALSIEALPQQPYEELLFNTGQMYYADDQTDKAIQKIEQYMAEAVNPIKPDAHIMLASAYAERKRFRDALPQVDQAIAKTPTPKESWLQLKLALHYELKQWPQCAEVLVRLISMSPIKEDYWKQLSSILFEIKKDNDSLAVLALAERQDFLNEETEIRNLYNLYMLIDIPHKAAKVLQGGLDRKIIKADEKTLTQLGDALTLAREYDKAEPVLKQAAAMSDKGDIYFRLGQIYVEDEKWKLALEMLEKAQSKSLKDPGHAAFLAGVAAYNLKDKARAIALLQRALGYDETRSNATQWLNHIRQTEELEAAQREAAAAREAPAKDKTATN